MICHFPFKDLFLNKAFRYVSWLLMIDVILLIVSGCVHNSYSDKLTLIDSLLQADPDSAYNLICDFDTSLLTKDNDRHYYSLLMAEARDKTFQEDSTHNVISDAADYFIMHGDKRNAMRSLFYKGRKYQDAANYGAAIITFLKSIELTDTTDHLYRGKIYNSISESYKAVSDAPQELEYVRRSLEEYQKLDSLVFIEDMKLAYGYALCRNYKMMEGLQIMQEVLHAAEARNDEERMNEALINLSMGYLWGGCDKNAKDCMSLLYSRSNDFFQSNEYAYLYIDALLTANTPIDSIKLLINKLKTSGSLQEIPFRYYAYNNNYEEAYNSLLKICQENEAHFADRIHSSANQEIEEYLEQERNTLYHEVSHLNGVILWVSISFLLLICLISACIWLYIVIKRKKEKDVLYSMEILIKEKAEITKIMETLKTENQYLANRNSSLIKEQNNNPNPNPCEQPRNNNNYEADLLARLFKELDMLHAAYYTGTSDGHGKTTVLEQMSKQLKLLRENKDMLNNMEGHINNINGGLLADVYREVKLNNEQRRIVALLCLGFSKESVSQIMDVSLQNYYTRMYRLTKRIEGCSSPRKEELLTLFRRKGG